MQQRSVGVEEEFLLIGRDGSLADVGDEVAQEASKRDREGQYEHELKRAQAEIGSKPTEQLDELAADLRQLRRALARVAADNDAILVASATHPSDGQAARTTAEARYEQMTATFGEVARQQLTCGMHVHVGVDSPDEGVAVIDRIRPYLSLLTALSANSPFYRGTDTGHASYRTILWGQWPTAGQTETFGDLARYRQVQRELITSGAALDEGMLYFDARLSANYPTVEVRVADVCPDLSSAIAIAGLTRALVETAVRDELPGELERVDQLRARAWRAARWGLSGELLNSAGEPAPGWACVEALVRVVTPALRSLGDLALVTDSLSEIRTRGTGADRQRAAHRAGGFDAVYDVVRVPGSP